ncbi:MAG: zinc ABC transporter substrate-binding protein [Anaerolineales bacterium]|nr:zinc ABC transporter substrate-binding protein [Anaerolineales bacterium]
MVATTSIVSDVVSQIGGEKIELITLLPLGADPHGYEPTPQDIARVADADVIFANGAGLEEFIEHLIESAGAQEKIVPVSEGIALMQCEEEHEHEGEAEGHEQEGEEGESHQDLGADPHTWTDPNNVMIWAGNIAGKLSELDPENADFYQANAEKYIEELKGLDAWIRQQASQLPDANRRIVTDHTLFCYFSDEYGFEQVGAIFPGYSTSAQPSAQELAALEDSIKNLAVKAVFVGNTVNPELAQRVAEDTSVRIVFIYTGSLSEPGGEAGTYLDYMRYNVQAIVEALK